MKRLLLLPMLLLSLNVSANTFCEGFEEGFQQAAYDCLYSAVTPVCPIEPINSSGWRSGYGIGYARANKEICKQ